MTDRLGPSAPGRSPSGAEEATVADEVELVLPARSDLLSLARLTVATVASRADFDFEAVEDLRLAIDELCSPFVGSDDSTGRLRLAYRWDADEIEVSCRVSGAVAAAAGTDGGEERELSDRILDALVDEHGSRVEDGGVCHLWLRKRRRPAAS